MLPNFENVSEVPDFQELKTLHTIFPYKYPEVHTQIKKNVPVLTINHLLACVGFLVGTD